jgi:hypothetical protein
MGTAQAVLALGLAAFHLMMAGTAIAWAPIVFTLVFGTVIGTFMSTYRNWTYRGPWYSQLVKSALISAAFAYPLTLLTHHWSVTANALILLNIGLNNAGKVAWQAIPRMFEKYHHYQAVRPLVWSFKVGDLLNQGLYLINWFLRFIALCIPTWLGYLPMLIGIVVGVIASFVYAKVNRYPEAARMIGALRRWFRRA